MMSLQGTDRGRVRKEDDARAGVAVCIDDNIIDTNVTTAIAESGLYSASDSE
jgi:hypothetical protein